MNGTDKSSRREQWRRIGLIVMRALLIALAGYLAWWTAFKWLPGYIAALLNGDLPDWVRVGLGGLAGATLLVLVQSIVQLPNRIADLIRSLPQRPWEEFRRRSLGVAEIVLVPGLCLLFAMGLGKEASDSSKAEAASIALEQTRKAMRLQGYTAQRASRLDSIGVGTRGSNDYFARFPVAFLGSELPKGAATGDIDLDDVEFERGVKFTSQPDALLAGLVEALSPCGSPKRKVRLRIEGYASSQPFPGIGRDQSVRLNVRLANQRARRVAEVLAGVLEANREAPERFDDLDVAVYGELWEMERDRQFNDRPFGTASQEARPQDFLTRAAHIKVMDAGNCAVGVAGFER